MQWFLRFPISIVCVLGLVGCGTTSAFKTVTNKSQAWQAYQQQALAINSWQVSGVIGIIKDQQPVSGDFVWHQTRQHYQMDINGPLGLGAVQLKGLIAGKITLSKDGRIYQANDLATLMQQQLGWHVPVNGLLYWARGIPVPGAPYQKTINPYGFTQMLQQQGWVIRYEAYMHVGHQVLPQKIVLQREGLKIKWVVDSWSIEG